MVKKAHLVTGKGGVGKSLFAAVLARYFSSLVSQNRSEKQSILLTELSDHSFYKDYLKLPDISYKPQAWKTNLDVCQWSPEDCLKEYSLYLLKIESLYKLFFENPVSKSLIQISPGLHELSLLGKLTSSPRHVGPPMSYDQIVVDSYSTGHFLSLLRAPAGLASIIPVGPMGEQSRSIDSYIRNPEFTEVHIVTLAEQLPLTESIELFQQLKNEFGIIAKVYLNKIYDLHADDLSGLSVEQQDPLLNIIENEKKARVKLQNTGIQFLELPFVASTESEILINHLTQALMRQK